MSAVGWFRCKLSGSHRYEECNRIQKFSMFHKEDRLAAKCSRCGDVIYVSMGDSQ